MQNMVWLLSTLSRNPLYKRLTIRHIKTKMDLSHSNAEMKIVQGMLNIFDVCNLLFAKIV